MIVMQALNLVGVPEERMERLAHPEGFSPAGLKVLVVDDDLLCLMILERMLRQCKYAVGFEGKSWRRRLLGVWASGVGLVCRCSYITTLVVLGMFPATDRLKHLHCSVFGYFGVLFRSDGLAYACASPCSLYSGRYRSICCFRNSHKVY